MPSSAKVDASDRPVDRRSATASGFTTAIMLVLLNLRRDLISVVQFGKFLYLSRFEGKSHKAGP